MTWTQRLGLWLARDLDIVAQLRHAETAKRALELDQMRTLARIQSAARDVAEIRARLARIDAEVDNRQRRAMG